MGERVLTSATLASVEGLGPDSYGEAFADVYDQWYADLGDGTDLAAHVAAHRGDGPVLELGVGSGRVVAALEAHGCTVVGLDASTSMLRQCRARHASTALVRADMGRPPLAAGRLGAVVVAFNTLFNLAGPGEQASAIEQLARALRPDGVLIIECLTGDGLFDGPTSSVGVRSIEADEVVLTATKVDAAERTLAGQHVTFTEAGTRLRPWFLRISSPAELDEMATRAGLELVERRGGWAPDQTEVLDRHVSRYRHR